jgi:hypothetical protein
MIASMRRKRYNLRIPEITTPRLKKIMELQDKIEQKTISENELDDILQDFTIHLSTPSGTLDNYTGKYGKSVIESIKKRRPDLLTDEYIQRFIHEKIRRLYDHLYNNALLDKPIFLRSDMLKILTNYILGEKEQANVGQAYILQMPFIEKEGTHSVPLPRTIKEPISESSDS